MGSRTAFWLAGLTVCTICARHAGAAPAAAARRQQQEGSEKDSSKRAQELSTVYGFDDLPQEEGPDLCPSGIGSAWLVLPHFREHVFGPHPKVYTIAMPAVSLALVAILIISIPHLCGLFKWAPNHRNRAWMIRVVASVPLFICVSKWCAAFMPRTWKLWFLAGGLFEAFSFWTFMRVIKSLVTDRESGWIDKIVLENLDDEEVRMWAVPPLGCCFKGCCKLRTVHKKDLNLQRFLMWQFIIILPLVSILDWTENPLVEKHHRFLGLLETCSLLLAMYGLFALLEATHHRLGDLRTHEKFWSIKGVFIANTLIYRVCAAKMTNDVKIGDVCYSAGALASAWAALWTSLLCLPLALLSRRAWLYDDIVYSKDGKAHEGSSSEEESDEESCDRE